MRPVRGGPTEPDVTAAVDGPSPAPFNERLTPDGALPLSIGSFTRHLRAEKVSPNTVLAYVGAVDQLAA